MSSSTALEVPRAWRRTRPDRRPGSCRSTASRRRRRRSCASTSRAPGAGEELRRDRLDHPPLRRARVLRLVDQDVVEAAVEPPEHPGRGAGSRRAARSARSIRSSKSSSPSAALARAEGREPGAGEAGRAPLTRCIGRQAARARGRAARPRAPARRAPASGRDGPRARGLVGKGRGVKGSAPVPVSSAASSASSRAGAVGRGAAPRRAAPPPSRSLGPLASASGDQRRDSATPSRRQRRRGRAARSVSAGVDAQRRGERRGVERRRRRRAPVRPISCEQRVGVVAGSCGASAGEVRRPPLGQRRRAPPRAAPAPAGPRARRTAARRRPPAGSGAAAPRRRRGSSGSSARPASPAPGRTAFGRGRAASAGIASPGSPSSRSRARAARRRASPSRRACEQPVLHLRRRRLGVGEAEDALRLGARRAAAAPPGRSAPGSCPSRRWPTTQLEASGEAARDLRVERLAHAAVLRPVAVAPTRRSATGGRSRRRLGQPLRAQPRDDSRPPGPGSARSARAAAPRSRPAPRVVQSSSLRAARGRSRAPRDGARPGGRPSKPPAAAIAASSGSCRWNAAASRRSGTSPDL